MFEVMVWLIKVIAYGVTNVFVEYVESVVAESGLEVMFGLAYILDVALFACDEIYDVVRSAIC